MGIEIGSSSVGIDKSYHDKYHYQKSDSSKVEENFSSVSSGAELKDDSKDDKFIDIFSRMMEDNKETGALDKYQSGENLKAMSQKISDSSDVNVSRDNDVTKIDYMQVIRDRIDEIFVKIQNNDTEPSYQIGGRSFTEREWNELLDQFDEIEEALRELIEEAKEQQMKADERKDILDETIAVNEKNIEMLTTDIVRCSYPENDGEIMYITSYDVNGIRCKKSSNIGEEGYLWEIPFSSEEEYRRVCDFMNKFPTDANLRFASHDNFWEDFLDNKIDEADFLDFFLMTNNSVPDYTYTVQDSMYIDKEKAKYAQYMNPHGNKMYSGEEMKAMQNEIISKAAKRLVAEQKTATERYRQYNPEYNGERIFCMYPGGPLYNAEEIAELMMQNIMRN